MTSQNETTTGQTEETTGQTGNTGADKPSTPASTSAAKRSPAKAATRSQSKSSIVKAPEKGEVVFVLDDATRISPTEYLPNHRPIALSDFNIVGSLDIAGTRPIMADTFEIFTTDTLPEHRPVAVSNLLHIVDLHFLAGNRPIAPNDNVDPTPSVLMGYLD
ncbi:MAG TPA: hypothetical protein V6D02_08505 [Candidatus Obscuribacterales bacterium]